MSLADSDARTAALLLAIDPAGLRGAVIRARSAMLAENWIQLFTSISPENAPTKRVPANISEERLLGGLDFAATIATGRAVCERGVLALADGGSIVLNASTTRPSTYSHVARTLDGHSVRVERDGFSETHETTFAALVVQGADDEAPPAGIVDRVAFVLNLDETTRSAWANVPARALIQLARARLFNVRQNDDALSALARGAARLGITSVRTTLLALSVARAHAALYGRDVVSDEDVACSARLVFAPRASATEELDSEPTNAPEHESEASPSEPQRESVSPEAARETDSSKETDDSSNADVNALTEMVVRAAESALPSGMLAAAAARSTSARANAGRSGNELQQGVRGRQVGTRRGAPRGGARLDLVATLRASIPMQRVRRDSRTDGKRRVVELRADDFRVRRCSSPTTTTTLFVVDASGSAALHRLAEAKGAVELMLAEGYARRDRVSLIAFRGTVAECVLPATHALARARRAIAGMPAGGGTPLATALDLTSRTVPQLRRDGSQVAVVILTDGRANVALDGRGGRARAESEALEAAARLRASSVDVIWIDTASRSESLSRNLAAAAGARYLLLPSANARGLSNIAKAADRRA